MASYVVNDTLKKVFLVLSLIIAIILLWTMIPKERYPLPIVSPTVFSGVQMSQFISHSEITSRIEPSNSDMYFNIPPLSWENIVDIHNDGSVLKNVPIWCRTFSNNTELPVGHGGIIDAKAPIRNSWYTTITLSSNVISRDIGFNLEQEYVWHSTVKTDFVLLPHQVKSIAVYAYYVQYSYMITKTVFMMDSQKIGNGYVWKIDKDKQFVLAVYDGNCTNLYSQ